MTSVTSTKGSLKMKLSKVKWDEIMQSKDPSFACKSFLDTINYYLDEYAPLKKITRKELKVMTKPSNILNKCKYRDSLLHDISKEKDPRIKMIYILITKS